MWLATFRLAEVIALDHPLNPVRRELHLHELRDEVVLDPFSESEVAEYVARHSPAVPPDEAFVRTLHERSDGLPLFVAHILNDLTEAAPDGEAGEAATRVAALAVPEKLAGLIDHYIVRLSEEERSLLAGVRGSEP